LPILDDGDANFGLETKICIKMATISPTSHKVFGEEVLMKGENFVQLTSLY
jgi:hypothetical protein